MENEEIISAAEFCTHYNVELSFIQSLYESGLIEVVYKEESLFLPVDDMPQLEKLARMHYEMDINLEGIETICHLLKQIEQMQQHIAHLTNQLNLPNQQKAGG